MPGIFARLVNFGQHVVGVVWTYHLVCFAWIFFRADSFGTAWDYLKGFGDWTATNEHVTPFLVGLIALGMLFQFTPRDLGRELALSLRALPSLALGRSEEHTSELQSLMRISYAVFCLNKKKQHKTR